MKKFDFLLCTLEEILFEDNVSSVIFNTLEEGYLNILTDHENKNFNIYPGKIIVDKKVFYSGYGIGIMEKNKLVINSCIIAFESNKNNFKEYEMLWNI